LRRFMLALSAVFVTAAVASFILLFAVSETRSQAAESQYASDYSAVARTATPQENSFDENSVSQGTTGGQTASQTVLQAVREDMAEEERLPDYSQVVDNDTEGRFKAVGWQERSGGNSYAGEYAYAESGTEKKAARFKVNIPTAGDYAIYAWWPAARANSASIRFGVNTASGTKWTKVNQQRDGGMWVKLGTYEMEVGDRYAVRVSPEGESGRVVADAVAIVRGAASPPPDEEQAGAGSKQLYSASGGRLNGRDVVRVARRYIGTRYKYATCTKSRMSCTCLTKRTFSKFGHRLPMTEGGQWRHEPSRRVARSNLRPGDIVFFKENGRRNPITHIGIFSGRGYLVHASSYFGKVVESKMKYIDGYFGAKKLRLR
jgi:hypothetical protein